MAVPFSFLYIYIFLFLILCFSFCPSFYLFACLYYYAIVVIEDNALDSVGEGSHFTCFIMHFIALLHLVSLYYCIMHIFV